MYGPRLPCCEPCFATSLLPPPATVSAIDTVPTTITQTDRPAVLAPSTSVAAIVQPVSTDMPAFVGVRNTNNRFRQSPATSASDQFSTTSASHPPSLHGQRRRLNAAPSINRSVDQSLFGDKHKHTNLKQQIRSINRLLHKQHTLDPELVQRKQTELRILSDQLIDKQRRDRIDRIDRKYKMVKFIERQKVVRKMRTLHRQLTTLTSTSRGASEEERAIRADMERVQADLDYIDYYPRGTKYVALFASSKAEADANGTRETGRAAADDEDDDSDSELVVGGKHSKPHQPKPATASATPADRDEHRTNTELSPTTTTDPNATDRAATLEAQRAAIREAVKRAKAKATAGDKKAAAVMQGAGSKKETRRRETKDDFFVFEEVHDKTDEQAQDELDGSEREGEGEGRAQQRVEGKAGARVQRESDRRGGEQRRDSRDGVGRQNGWEQRRGSNFVKHEARQPFQRTTEHTVNSTRPLEQRKRQRDNEAEANQQLDSVGQQRSAYNPNKHVRVSEVKKTARKIADIDGSETAEDKGTEQPAEERKEERGVDAEAAAGEEGTAKRKRKRGKRKRADKTGQQQPAEEVNQPQQQASVASERKKPQTSATRGNGKQRQAADSEKNERGVEEDERKATRRQEAEIRDQRRHDVKSLLQLDDGQSDDEQ